MDLLGVLVAIVVVALLYVVVRWLLGILGVAVPEVVLQVGALLLLLLILLGRVSVGL